MGVLSKPAILRALKEGTIVIEPFNTYNLANTSYDVRLGNFFYRQKTLDHVETLNPFYEKSVRKMYSEVERARPVSQYKSIDNPFYNLGAGDLVIMVAPGETILAHTIEFIGGRNGDKKRGLAAVTTEMRARSSVGRLGIAVCKCAGWGDVGYVNRWTMEITNFSSSMVPLPVGLRIAQIIFHEVEPIESGDEYSTKGKYQTSLDIQKLQKEWKPEAMLPKLYLDKDLGQFKKYY